MADRRPPALKLPTAHKPPAVQAAPPAPPPQQEQNAAQEEQDAIQQVHQDPVQPHTPPAQVQNSIPLVQIQVQPGQPLLHWSYFKPEFSGKPKEDV